MNNKKGGCGQESYNIESHCAFVHINVAFQSVIETDIDLLRAYVLWMNRHKHAFYVSRYLNPNYLRFITFIFYKAYKYLFRNRNIKLSFLYAYEKRERD